MESEQERIIDEVAASIANLEAAARAAIKACQDERDAATARAEKAEAERDAYAKAKAENDERFQVEAGTWKALYAKAWEEIEAWRAKCGGRDNYDRSECGEWVCYFVVNGGGEEGEFESWAPLPAADAHDAARKEAGL